MDMEGEHDPVATLDDHNNGRYGGRRERGEDDNGGNYDDNSEIGKLSGGNNVALLEDLLCCVRFNDPTITYMGLCWGTCSFFKH